MTWGLAMGKGKSVNLAEVGRAGQSRAGGSLQVHGAL